MIIYKLFDNKTKNCYIGSTTNLYNRKRYHKNMKDCSCKEIIQNNDYEFIILEECENKDRRIREQYWIDNEINVINNNRALGQNTERYKTYQKVWKKERSKYEYSWGGDKRSSNNLLKIDINLFL